jgi:pyruvyltransferase
MELNSPPYVPAFWYSSNNFGDCLNHFLIKRLSGKPVVLSDRLKEHFIVCGSILTEANSFSTVWGAGFSWEHAQPYDHNAQYIAVRGNLSAERLEKSVKYVGDPALLLPLLYTPPAGKKYLYGIIPHWSEVEHYINRYPDIHIIDPFQSVTDFIDDLVSCEKVISSGLHGLIVADAYGIPNAWHAGAPKDWFKYFDYYTTTDLVAFGPITTIDFGLCEVHNYRYSKTELLNTCPFLKHGTD